MAFYGKTALISGGASGIGRVHARQLAAQGAKVAILDVNEQSLSETVALSENIIPLHCDVTNLQAVEAVVKQVEREIGVIDRLINCAAIMPGGLLTDATADLINRIMLINYHGMVNVCQTIVPGMLARNQGDVIIYGSTAGLIASPRFGAYGASKAANNLYAKVLAEENKQSKVRFLLVCPPAVDTPLINQAKEGPAILHNQKMRRYIMVTPEKVVESAEKCLEKGKKVCYPGPAKMVNVIARFLP
jgi:NAD(P)-dependent dehydrogenase (short-subunit alcohol dehydrogenase family)